MHALDLYAVDELLVAAEGKPGGLDAASWEEIAAERKAARLHRVPTNSSAGRRFCSSVQVAALLGRPVDPSEEPSPMAKYAPTLHAFAGVAAAIDSGVVQGIDSNEHPIQPRSRSAADMTVETDSASGSEVRNISRDAFFTWLRRSLCLEMADDVSGAIALFDCVQVILADGMGQELLQEALENAVTVIAQDAPICAAELQTRWWAAQFADSDSERGAGMEVSHVAGSPD